MRRVLTSVIVGAALVAGLAQVPAAAMGSGDPYVDMQAGVTYTVYEPAATLGLRLASEAIGQPCAPGDGEERIGAEYGTRNGRNFSVNEGRPICADIGGDGKVVATYRVGSARARLEVYCDPANPTQWRQCDARDVTRFGGNLSFRLPAATGLRATDIVIETLGARPLAVRELLQVARSLAPVAGA